MQLIKTISVIAFLLYLSSLDAATAPVKFRRICNAGNDNNLYWYRTSDTCTSFKGYVVWVRNGTSGGFSVLDTVKNKFSESYSHVGANVSGSKHWYYFIQNIDSCGPVFFINSDTFDVDNSQNYPSYIDSVSVDISTNKVGLGWTHNQAPDFALYDPFFQKTSSPNTYDYVLGSTGTRDTFIVDTDPLHNPSNTSLKYDLGTRDSCGNTSVFGENPHQTIFLQYYIDTCNKKCSLNWSPYSFVYTDNNGKQIQIGWKRVRKNYIYKKINSGLMSLIDSVDGSVLTYIDNIVLGQQVQYFIRAIKDTTLLITSSSNLCSFSTRQRLDPLNIKLINVSVDPITNGEISLSIENKNNEEWSKLYIYRSRDTLINASNVGIISNSGSASIIIPYSDYIDASSLKYYYQIHCINLCGINISATRVSNTILLSSTGEGSQNVLRWGSYNYWETGVEIYRVYRGIKLVDGTVNYVLIDSVSSNENSYIDYSFPSFIEGQGLCYYIQAQQNVGVNIVEQSNSNHSCIMGDLLVFTPNAFNPSGINKFFRPEGSFINYRKSTMEIYDRWGGKVMDILDITNGWDGKNSSGEYCPVGVYLYNIKIIGTNGTEQKKSGLITIID